MWKNIFYSSSLFLTMGNNSFKFPEKKKIYSKFIPKFAHGDCHPP